MVVSRIYGRQFPIIETIAQEQGKTACRLTSTSRDEGKEE
jgi:hypothetical protein